MWLIDADELIDELYQDQPMNWTGSDTEVQEFIDWELFRNMVINFPIIDAVPVVRCKDCKYFKTLLCQNEDNHDDWFCADGERKDGDGNG